MREMESILARAATKIEQLLASFEEHAETPPKRVSLQPPNDGLREVRVISLR
jgi:hypothetical protein